MALPGLGIFTLDKSVVLPEENDRALLSMPNAVQFQNANIASADKELISYICSNTGKIRPLAISDLDSYLNLGTEMLNIGKPFHLEGIGTISKNKNGKFDFTPGEYTLIREPAESQGSGKKSILKRDLRPQLETSLVANRNLIKILVPVIALIIVGWGGWVMYKKNKPAVSENSTDGASLVNGQQPSDTAVSYNTKNDSSKLAHAKALQPNVSNAQTATNYKFVILATENKPHALRRYQQLKSFDLKVYLYQKDSSFFKVYFQFPSLASDTSHIKDSLKREYAHNVTIEP